MRLKDKVAIVTGAASGMGAVAAANLFLASDEASYSVELPVDGGYLAM
jgi:NAD(P)-dependent dehydrogenase (short-subunit alcohol dehydrogenase family)